MIKCLETSLNTIANISTIIGFIYGFFWLRNFKKQKKLENKSSDARRALDELVFVNQVLADLYTGIDRQRHEVLKETLPIYLKKLQYTLSLLSGYSGIQDGLDLITKIISILSKNKSNPQVASDEIQSIQAKNKFDTLEKSLLKIYELNI
ncbi:MAG: hypothetical protein WDZ41_02170 [Candidatus Babeliales bacterium]